METNKKFIIKVSLLALTLIAVTTISLILLTSNSNVEGETSEVSSTETTTGTTATTTATIPTESGLEDIDDTTTSVTESTTTPKETTATTTTTTAAPGPISEKDNSESSSAFIPDDKNLEETLSSVIRDTLKPASEGIDRTKDSSRFYKNAINQIFWYIASGNEECVYPDYEGYTRDDWADYIRYWLFCGTDENFNIETAEGKMNDVYSHAIRDLLFNANLTIENPVAYVVEEDMEEFDGMTANVVMDFDSIDVHARAYFYADKGGYVLLDMELNMHGN